MHIGVVAPLYPPYSRVGAWLTTHEHLRHLVARDHRVTVTTTMATRATYVHDGVEVRGRGLPARGDVIVAHVGDQGFGRAAAAQAEVPLIYLAHGRVKDPTHLIGADLVVFVSNALRDETDWDGPAVVAAPPVDPADYQVTPGDAATLVNLNAEKGAELFWLLAAAMPAQRFVAVKGGYGRQIVRTAPNVNVVGYPVTDMRTVYARTRVLLMPSVTETWGRVALEAAASGIPTIAHPSPGLVESLGDAGVWVDRMDIAGWRRELERLDDPTEWATASARASDRAAHLDPACSLTAVADAIETFAPVEVPA